MAKMDFDKILSATAAKLGFNSLREKQVETVTALMYLYPSQQELVFLYFALAI